jgi:hypothetical protein
MLTTSGQEAPGNTRLLPLAALTVSQSGKADAIGPLRSTPTLQYSIPPRGVFEDEYDDENEAH